MPSHLKDDDPLPPNVTREDILGNRLADELAGKAATRFRLPLHITGPYIYYISVVERIQHRLASIITNLPARVKNDRRVTRSVPMPFPSVSELITESQHVVHSDGSRVSCARCHNSFAACDPNLKLWLRTACSAIASCADRPVPLPFEELHIGNKFTHISHQLNKYRGLVYCRRCGCRAGSAVLRNLSERCKPPTSYGTLSIKALQDGRLPPNLSAWPDGLP